MKVFIVIGLWFIVTIFFASPIFAEGESCIYPQYCDAGSGITSGQQSCSGTIQQNVCKYDSAAPPNCSQCELITITPPVSTSSATPSATPSAQIGGEEAAIYNLNRGLIPKEIIQQSSKKEIGFFSGLLEFLNKFISLPRFFGESENLQQTALPLEFKEPDNTKEEDKIKGFLGGSTGFYGSTLPKFESVQDNDIRKSEQLYQQSNFPKEIEPLGI